MIKPVKERVDKIFACNVQRIFLRDKSKIGANILYMLNYYKEKYDA